MLSSNPRLTTDTISPSSMTAATLSSQQAIVSNVNIEARNAQIATESEAKEKASVAKSLTKHQARWAQIGQHFIEHLQKSDPQFSMCQQDDHKQSYLLPETVSTYLSRLFTNVRRETSGLHPQDFAVSENKMFNNSNLFTQATKGLWGGINKLFNQNVIDPQKQGRNDYLTLLICACWAIYNQGDDFKRGSYKIIGPQADRLYTLFEQYVVYATQTDQIQHVLPSGTALVEMAKPSVIKDLLSKGFNPFAYSRNPSESRSSHYKESPNQFGIDMRFDANALSSHDFLPHGHTHILFGLVEIDGQNTLFLKFEEEGLGDAQEAIQHGLSFLKSSHADGKTRREKDIPKPFLQAYQDFFGHAPEKGQPLFKLWEDMVATSNITEGQRKAKEEAIRVLDTAKLAEHVQQCHGQECIIRFTLPGQINAINLVPAIALVGRPAPLA